MTDNIEKKERINEIKSFSKEAHPLRGKFEQKARKQLDSIKDEYKRVFLYLALLLLLIYAIYMLFYALSNLYAADLDPVMAEGNKVYKSLINQ